MVVLPVGAEDRDLAVVEPGRHDQPVQGVRLRLPPPHRADRLGHPSPRGLHLERPPVGTEDPEVVEEPVVAIGVDVGGDLLDDPEPEVLEDRHDLRELDPLP